MLFLLKKLKNDHLRRSFSNPNKLEKFNETDNKRNLEFYYKYFTNLGYIFSKYDIIIIQFKDELKEFEKTKSNNSDDTITTEYYSSSDDENVSRYPSYSSVDKVELVSHDSSSLLSYIDIIQDNFYKKFQVLPYYLLDLFAIRIQRFYKKYIKKSSNFENTNLTNNDIEKINFV